MNSIDSLAALSSPISAYTDTGRASKAKMHSAGRAFLRRLAADLGLAKGSFDIRSNQGGIAVSGEVTLHGERIYVQLSESYFAPYGVSILYRGCCGRKDYSGGRNNNIRMKDAAANYPAFVAACKRIEMEVVR